MVEQIVNVNDGEILIKYTAEMITWVVHFNPLYNINFNEWIFNITMNDSISILNIIIYNFKKKNFLYAIKLTWVNTCLNVDFLNNKMFIQNK